jgi:SagB-type dehydrogenase family enzyme
MKILIFIFLISQLLVIQGGFAMNEIQLPKPQINKTLYLDQAIQQRRSVRSFKDKELTLNQISQLLWATQGITDPNRGLRSAPSAGALYPLTIYLVKKDGIWQYDVNNHSIKLIVSGDLRKKLAQAALGQDAIKEAPLNIIITADYKKITPKYHERGIRYTHIETGHAAQNLILEAVALGLSSVTIGAFYDEKVNSLLKLPGDQVALYIIPIGYKK